MSQSNRQAVTKTAIMRRLEDAGVHRMPDWRKPQGKRIAHRALMFALALAAVSAVRTLRGAERLTARLSPNLRKKTRIKSRISDTKLRDALLSRHVPEARFCLVRQVKKEHRRGGLKPSRLGFGVVAIDGKSLGKLDVSKHRHVQNTHPKDGAPYGLARVHRATLVSSQAAVCIDQRPIEGTTNEIGALPDFLEQLFETYGRTNLFEVILGDAGNCSVDCATKIHDRDYGYFLRIKSTHGEIFKEARRRLKADEAAEFEVVRREKGARVTYRLWRIKKLEGWLTWTHARQLFRIERTVDRSDGEPEVGNRYFVTNLACGRLQRSSEWLELAKMYWRCENENHWTADVFFDEDATRTPWTTDPEAVYVMSFLRMLGLNVLAVLRAACRCEYTHDKLPWQEIIVRVQMVLRAQIEEQPALS
jgi:hypothetical protein